MNAITEQQPSVVPVMVGTAGHVDHGKTALVGLLTGCDTDTLQEEKERGLSIDLGFAPFLLRDSRMVGIIDVPGHEDFIRNMVAGASSIDVLMLVIAADDGIMPQTIEHLKIVALLRTPLVMAVITKVDLVSDARRREIKETVRSFLAENGFPGAAVILESSKTGDGIDEVRETINQLVGAVRRPVQVRAFRMEIERSFSVPGYGTVVTGIPSGGHCAVGDELELFPGPKRVACRAIQKYSRAALDTEAHVCSAVNISNIKASEIERGMTLAACGVYRQTPSALISLRNVHDSIIVKRNQEMRFCCGTSSRVVSGLLIGANSLGPGECGFMQIRFPAPIVLAAGDKFILRSLSPATTVAGGVVLASNIGGLKKKARFKAELLEAARSAAWDNDVFLSELIAGNSAVISRGDAPFLAQCEEKQAKKIMDDKKELGVILPLGPSHWLVKSRFCELEEKLREALAKYHKQNTISRGLPASGVCSLLGLDNRCLDDLKTAFAGSGCTAQSGYFALKGFTPALSAKQQALRERAVKAVIDAGKSAVSVVTLQAQLGAAVSEMQALTRLLSDEGGVTVLGDHFIHSAIVNECLNKLLLLFESREVVELGLFRQAAGLSRNIAVPMLELFDSRGVTCRQEKGRKLLTKKAGDINALFK